MLFGQYVAFHLLALDARDPGLLVLFHGGLGSCSRPQLVSPFGLRLWYAACCVCIQCCIMCDLHSLDLNRYSIGRICCVLVMWFTLVCIIFIYRIWILRSPLVVGCGKNVCCVSVRILCGQRLPRRGWGLVLGCLLLYVLYIVLHVLVC